MAVALHMFLLSRIPTAQAQQLNNEVRLYRCSDDSGTLKVTEVKTGPLMQHDLSSQVGIIPSLVMYYVGLCSYRYNY